MNTLDDCWQKLVRTEAHRPVIYRDDHGWVSVGDLEQQVGALATDWRQAGLRRGQILLLRLPNGAPWLVAFLAAQRLGLCVAAADYATPEAVLLTLADDLRAAWLWTDAGLRAGCLRPLRLRPPACLAKLTSGSTGRPQGLRFGADEMLADGRAIIAAMGIRPEDRNLGLIPLGHSYGLGNLVLPLLLQGTAIVCTAQALPRFAAQVMATQGVTICPAVPSFFRALAETDLPVGALGPLRTAISAGSRLPPEVAQRFLERYGVRLHNFLGSSETGGIAYDHDGSASLSGQTVGRLLPGVSIGTATGGRLLVTGPAVWRGGRRKTASGEAAFALGDRGQLLPDGQLQLLGRATALAKIGGRRVDPLEVERVLASLPGVVTAVVRVIDSPTGDRLAAVVEGSLSAPALRELIRAEGRLPEWKVPRRLVVVPTLARDQRGKISRASIDALLAGGG